MSYLEVTVISLDMSGSESQNGFFKSEPLALEAISANVAVSRMGGLNWLSVSDGVQPIDEYFIVRDEQSGWWRRATPEEQRDMAVTRRSWRRKS